MSQKKVDAYKVKKSKPRKNNEKRKNDPAVRKAGSIGGMCDCRMLDWLFGAG